MKGRSDLRGAMTLQTFSNVSLEVFFPCLSNVAVSLSTSIQIAYRDFVFFSAAVATQHVIYRFISGPVYRRHLPKPNKSDKQWC